MKELAALVVLAFVSSGCCCYCYTFGDPSSFAVAAVAPAEVPPPAQPIVNVRY